MVAIELTVSEKHIMGHTQTHLLLVPEFIPGLWINVSSGIGLLVH